MEEKAETVTETGTEPKPSLPLCEECCQRPFKYRCPGCSLRTCSLPCVKTHKNRTNCTGKRNRTQFVPLSQFDDNLLLSDYRFLEEANRVADSARRIRDGLFKYPSFRHPHNLKQLVRIAGWRKTQVVILPNGMSKRTKNRSFCNMRNKSIFWTIEWKFHSTNVVLINHKINEQLCLYPIIEKILKPGLEDPQPHHQLRLFSKQLNDLTFLIQKNSKDTKSPFRKLNINASLSPQLANIILTEYPVIHVLLPSHTQEFVIDKDENPVLENPDPSGHSNDLPSAKGVYFKEEEIIEEEEASCSDKQVLYNHANAKRLDNVPVLENMKEVTEDVKLVSCNEIRADREEEADWYSKQELGVTQDMTFDFEEVLRYACLEDGLLGEGDVNGRKMQVFEELSPGVTYGEDLAIFDDMIFGEENLEEGEIPDC